jgi:hypothetical protein
VRQRSRGEQVTRRTSAVRYSSLSGGSSLRVRIVRRFSSSEVGQQTTTRGCVDAWLTSTGHAKGYIMDLATLWRLAFSWYDGRLGSPYRRKDPQSAADYFRSVGLHGRFWGLID